MDIPCTKPQYLQNSDKKTPCPNPAREFFTLAIGQTNFYYAYCAGHVDEYDWKSHRDVTILTREEYVVSRVMED